MRISGDARLDRRHRQGDPRHPPGGRRHALRPRRRLQRREPCAARRGHRRPRRRRRAARRRSARSRSTPPCVFDRPWDRHAVEADNPVLERVEVRDLAFTWGKLDLRGKRKACRWTTRASPRAGSTCTCATGGLMLDVAEASGRAQPHPRRRGPLRPRARRPALGKAETPSTCRSTSPTASRAWVRSASARRRASFRAQQPSPAFDAIRPKSGAAVSWPASMMPRRMPGCG